MSGLFCGKLRKPYSKMPRAASRLWVWDCLTLPSWKCFSTGDRIGKRVLLTSGSITTAIDRLESKKLVRRTTDPQDMRSRIVDLTSRGREVIQRAFRQHALDIEETMAILKPRERTELIRLLKKLGMWAAARLEDV